MNRRTGTTKSGLLAVDIGNTETTIGVYAYSLEKTNARRRCVYQETGRTSFKMSVGAQCVELVRKAFYRIPTAERETGDSLYCRVDPHLSRHSFAKLIVASVVPPNNAAWHDLGERIYGCETRLLGPLSIPGIDLKIDNPSEAGVDRIVNSWMGFRKYGGPLVVVDTGTATTFDAVSADGAYLGGVISPGMALFTDALSQRTARLPRIDLSLPERTIGRNTRDALRSGIVLGHAKMIQGVLAEMRRELKFEKAVGTGGLMCVLQPALEKDFHAFDEYLTLDGAAMLGLI